MVWSAKASSTYRKTNFFLDPSSWSPKLSELVKCSQVAVVPYSLDLDYGFWKYCMYVKFKIHYRVGHLLMYG